MGGKHFYADNNYYEGKFMNGFINGQGIFVMAKISKLNEFRLIKKLTGNRYLKEKEFVTMRYLKKGSIIERQNN